MCEQWSAGARTRLYVTIAILIAVVIPVLACGCGPSTPQAAVENYYDAVSNRDWNAYLNAILPENVRRMTSADAQSAKGSFKDNSIKYTDLKFKTIPNAQDKNRAEVQMISGTVAFKNPNTGENKKMTVAEIKRTYNVNAIDKVVKYKGRWYVDVPMASADLTTQQ
jgi:hypothetical protein